MDAGSYTHVVIFKKLSATSNVQGMCLYSLIRVHLAHCYGEANGTPL